MKNIIIDTKLKPSLKQFRGFIKRETVLCQTFDEKKGERLFFNNVSEKAQLYHSNYLEYLQQCYANHHKIVISPHIMWHSIVAEIANHVCEFPKNHSKIFTRSPDKKIDLIIPCNSPTEPLRMEEMYSELINYVPIDTSNFVVNFSTTTEQSRLATLGAFLETCSPYYNYFMLLCGYPEIKIDGNMEDWKLIKEKLVILKEIFATKCENSKLPKHIENNMIPIVNNIITAYTHTDGTWLKTIFSHKPCGSGSDFVVDGWFTHVYMKQPQLKKSSNYETHISKVPYTILPTNTKWKMAFFLSHSFLENDEFMIPQYSMVQIECKNG